VSCEEESGRLKRFGLEDFEDFLIVNRWGDKYPLSAGTLEEQIEREKQIEREGATD